jgi:hypothetical protein
MISYTFAELDRSDLGVRHFCVKCEGCARYADVRLSRITAENLGTSGIEANCLGKLERDGCDCRMDEKQKALRRIVTSMATSFSDEDDRGSL